MLYLDGKIGIVTGAAGGLGFEIAKELTKNGATVIITSRKKSKLRKACSLINKNCQTKIVMDLNWMFPIERV